MCKDFLIVCKEFSNSEFTQTSTKDVFCKKLFWHRSRNFLACLLIYCSLITQMQDDVNVPGCPIALGFTLEKLSAHTIDEAGKEVFVHKNALDLLRKVKRTS